MNVPTLTHPPSSFWRVQLSRQSRRRALVLVWALCCAAVITLALLGVTGIVWFALFAVLLGTDVVLFLATHRVADFSTPKLDERQQALRNRAYRTAYLLIAGGSIVAVGTSVLLATGTSVGVDWLAHSGQHVAVLTSMGVVVLQLLCLLPTALVAWTEPDEPGEVE